VSHGWSAVARNCVPFFGLLALAPWLHSVSPVAPWLLAPLLGLFAYRITIVMHDCIHRSLFEEPARNVRVGRWLGALTGIDFSSFATQHLRHHRSYGAAGDPQGFQYLGLKRARRLEFAWRVLRPLLGWNLRYVLPESLFAPRNLRKEFFAFLSVQAVVLVIVTGAGRYWWLAALPFISSATFGLFFSQLRGIAEHAALRDEAEAGNVRSHAAHWLDRVFLYDLNFNYHAEHHRFPAIPSWRLAELNSGGSKIAPSMFHTLAAVLPARSS
jgi:fatty acid desaturase